MNDGLCDRHWLEDRVGRVDADWGSGNRGSSGSKSYHDNGEHCFGGLRRRGGEGEKGDAVGKEGERAKDVFSTLFFISPRGVFAQHFSPAACGEGKASAQGSSERRSW